MTSPGSSVPGELEMHLIARTLRTGQRVSEVASFESARRFGHSILRTCPDGGWVLRSLLREQLADLTAPVEARVADVPVDR